MTCDTWSERVKLELKFFIILYKYIREMSLLFFYLPIPDASLLFIDP